jgi:hypothetical protein
VRLKFAVAMSVVGLAFTGIAAPSAFAGKHHHHRGCTLINRPPICISLGK